MDETQETLDFDSPLTPAEIDALMKCTYASAENFFSDTGEP